MFYSVYSFVKLLQLHRNKKEWEDLTLGNSQTEFVGVLVCITQGVTDNGIIYVLVTASRTRDSDSLMHFWCMEISLKLSHQ